MHQYEFMHLMGLHSQPASGQKVREMLEGKDIDSVLRFQSRSMRVDDHLLFSWDSKEFAPEWAWTRQQALVRVLGQKVKNVGIGECGPEQSALTGSSGTHQKEALLRSLEHPGEHKLTTMSSFFIEI